MNKEYKVKLDLNKRLYNKKMTFNQFDENVNDFYIEVTKNNEVVKDLDKAVVTLVAIKPDSTVEAQFVEAKNGEIHATLNPSMCDLIGNYQAKAMITLGTEIITTDTINYSVNEDKIISKLNEDIVSDERFTLLTDALSRLSAIELNENTRELNEANRLELQSNLQELFREVTESEVDRKEHEVLREKTHLKMKDTLEEAEDVISNAIATNTISSELITSMNLTHERVLNTHQDVINAKADMVNTVSSEISKQTLKVDNKIVEVNNIKNQMVSQVTNATSDANRIVGIAQRVIDETNEAREDIIQDSQSSIKSITDNANLNITRLSNNADSSISSIRSSANKVISDVNTVKSSMVSSINSTLTAKVNEVNKAKSDMTNTISNKVKDIDTRFNALTSKQQQDAEVIDARGEYESLRLRLEVMEKSPLILFEDIEG